MGRGVGMCIGLVALLMFASVTMNQSMYRLGASVSKVLDCPVHNN